MNNSNYQPAPSVSKALSLLVAAISCLFLAFVGAGLSSEGYNFITPAIDTRYGPGFEEARFDAITVGMDTAAVAALLGRPLHVQLLTWDVPKEASVLWYYTSDGKLDKGDFAWLGREVYFDKNGWVVETGKPVHYD